ncbi:hypothetical protein IGL98_003233 [Enterococcus sp. DIV0840]|uniref:helix-turn-helix domain-containing protein n=1 Tax=Enterococcus TaxID=1350 RepID=UPI001A8FBB58|nr:MULTISPECIES: helix-turn-helix domain-containing protein [Enterococcus]MBO0434833.1 helix-turn-helix domain-containing protein [Enterococcus sp. DIV0849a]MBO0475256.1 helix-turn-helix domain-containing protein [Enterococcus ureasiticus]
MKKILCSRTKRKLELVELLLDNDWVSFAKATEFLNISVKTLKSDIIELETIISPVTVESSKIYGIRIAPDISICKSTIYKYFIENSVEFQLIETIFNNTFSTLPDLANYIYISTSTVKRIAYRVNKYLQTEGFIIDLKKIQLVGDPYSICNFMQLYFQERYGISESLLSSNQLAILDLVNQQIISQFMPKEEFQDIDFFLLNRLRIYTYTIINLLKYNSENQLNGLPKREFDIINDSHARDEFYSQFTLSLSSKNLNIFFYLIFSEQSVNSIETIRKLTRLDRNALLKYQKIEILIQKIEKQMDCHCSDNDFDNIFIRLYNLDYQIHGRTFILYNKEKEFFKNIEKLYGTLQIDLIHSLQAIFYANPYKEYIVYEALSILFMHWPQILDCLEYSTPKLKACLLFNSSFDYMNMLSERIDYYLRGRFSCTPIKVRTLEELEREASAYDCIITNIPQISIDTVPIIVIPLIPDAKSFDKLLIFYEDFFNNR